MPEYESKPLPDVVERFMRYVQIDSQSDPEHDDVTPSTPRQHEMARYLGEELTSLGCTDVTVDEHAYVTGTFPASPDAQSAPALMLCSHLDSVIDAPAAGIKPHIVHYEGGNLVAGVVAGEKIETTPEQVPDLEKFVGMDIVCSDGSTLLSADDKAGVAEICALLKRLSDNPELKHPTLKIAFVPDEEIGHGAALLDLDAFGATYGYTIDGGPLGEFCYETFNAAEVHVQATGLSVHTGTAKGIMINAAEALMRFHQLLPPQDRPEYTEGYDGFFYLERMQGDCEYAQADYIIRDHDQKKVEKRKQMMRDAVSYVNYQLDSEVLTISVKDQYHNLADVITRPENEHLIENARVAYAAIGQEMTCIPMRGGTDGSQLSFRGFPCANLSACYYNAHGVREFVPVPELEAMVDVLQALVALYAEKSS